MFLFFSHACSSLVYEVHSYKKNIHLIGKFLWYKIKQDFTRKSAPTHQKATKFLGLMKSTLSCWSDEIARTIYLTFIRPHLEFDSSVWNPHLKYDSNMLENVQRRATFTRESSSSFGLRRSSRRLFLLRHGNFSIHRSLFATSLGYEPSCAVVGPLALTHLSSE